MSEAGLEGEALGVMLIAVSLERERFVLAHWSITSGYRPLVFTSAQELRAEVRRNRACVLIMDKEFDDVRGLEVISSIRAERIPVPVMFIADWPEDPTAEEIFKAGANDFIRRPMYQDLFERIMERIRCGAATFWDVVSYGSLVIDGFEQEARVHGCPVRLTATELRLVRHVICKAGRVVPYDDIDDQVFGRTAGPRTIQVHLRRARQKLSEAGWEHRIETLRGEGLGVGVPGPGLASTRPRSVLRVKAAAAEDPARAKKTS